MSPLDEASITTYIRTARDAKKLRNADLAHRTGYTLGKIDRIINGRQRLMFHDVRVFADALGFTDRPDASKEQQFLHAASLVRQSVTTDHADG